LTKSESQNAAETVKVVISEDQTLLSYIVVPKWFAALKGQGYI
jgi:hypothetical protein